MNRISATVAALWAVFSMSAQFNTVSRKPSLYHVETVTEAAHPAFPGKAASDSLAAAGQERELETLSPYEDAVERYLSLSFPLKSLVVTSPFGRRPDPFTGKKAKHRGLDLRADHDKVYAMLEGVVEKVGYEKRGGGFVKLRHGDYTVSYCHLSAPLVRKGDKVAPGQAVGVTGSTGRATGPHLHITMKHKGKFIDPSLFIEGIRLVKKSVLDELANAGEAPL